jgi:arginine repressor
MKTQRHAAILRIVRGETVGSQEQLRERLKAEGYNVTQATLSRDIRELGLAKVAGQRRLRHVVPFGLETLAQLLLAAYRLPSNDPQDGRVTLRFHVAEI